MSRYCLDTVAYSHFKRGEGKITEFLDRAVWTSVPVIAFLSAPVVEVLPVDRDVAEIFGEIILELRRQGRPIPTNDIWIAATCARAGATLITWDGHFRSISRVSTMILE